MKNKHLFSVLSLALISGVLSSCGNTNSLSFAKSTRSLLHIKASSGSAINVTLNENGEIIKINDPSMDPNIVGIKSMIIDSKAVSLFYSDSKRSPYQDSRKLNVVCSPITAKTNGLVWTSLNPEIATVDNEGVVTAISEGVATIKVSNAEGTISDTTRVVVNNANVMVSTAAKSAKKIYDTQTSAEFNAPKTIKIVENYTKTRVIGGTVTNISHSLQTIWASKEHSYFRITSQNEDIYTADGSVVPSYDEYVFYTTSNYYGYVFCMSNGKKNYMTLDISKLVDKGQDHYEGLLQMLDSFFTSGRKIMSSQFEDALETKTIKDGYSGSAKIGSFGENSGQFAFNKVDGGVLQVKPDEEEDIEIPAYTRCQLTDDTTYLWENNVVSSRFLTETIEYPVDTKANKVIYQMDTSFDSENIELLMPELSQFTKVDDIFGL